MVDEFDRSCQHISETPGLTKSSRIDDVVNPVVESCLQQSRTVRKQMTVTFTHDHFSDSRHCGDHMTRLDRQDLIGIAMKEQKWFATKTGRYFATSRLSRKRDHTDDFVHHHSDTHGHRTSEGMSHDHDALRSGVGRQLNRCRHIETTCIEIIRSAIRHANHRNTSIRPCISEFLVQTFGWAEKTSHRSTAGHDRRWSNRLTCWYLVPHQRHHALHREHLDMTKRRCDHHRLGGNDAQSM